MSSYKYKVLVIANRTADSTALRDAMQARFGRGRKLSLSCRRSRMLSARCAASLPKNSRLVGSRRKILLPGGLPSGE